jgi:DNA-binding NarL/FixJ family response regulator
MELHKILLVDDHPLFRRGVKEILVGDFPSIQIGECASANEMLEVVDTDVWDLVIMDISMPGLSGPESLRLLKARHPEVPVLVMSMHPEDQYAVRMFKAGADGYLTKASATDELIQAIKKVCQGGQYVSPSVGETLALNVKCATSERLAHERLSDREYQVMCLIASGQTVSEIAEAIHLSVTTISTYRARILEKMGMKNNAELTRYAIQNTIVS